jgi:hypothetical protein
MIQLAYLIQLRIICAVSRTPVPTLPDFAPLGPVPEFVGEIPVDRGDAFSAFWGSFSQAYHCPLYRVNSSLVRVSLSHLASKCALALCAEAGKYYLFGFSSPHSSVNKALQDVSMPGKCITIISYQAVNQSLADQAIRISTPARDAERSKE